MTDTTDIRAVILAAGSSSRMGRFKPLMALGGRTIVERVIFVFREAGILDIRVVVGHRREELEPLLERLDVRVLVNDRHEDGMFSSVLRAIRDMGNSVSAVFILPADIPLIRSWTVRCLVTRHRLEPHRILIPSCRGRRGHPVVIPAQYFDTILAYHGENGLRGALGQFPDAVLEVQVADRNIHFDLDTPEDYEECLRRWSTMSQEGKRMNTREVRGI